MDSHKEPVAEYVDLDAVELGFIVSPRTLIEVIKTLRADARRWWVSDFDPLSTIERGYLVLYYGTPDCNDELNVASFRVPVWSHKTEGPIDKIVVLVERSNFIAVTPPLGRGSDRELRQEWEDDFNAAFEPIKQALARRMLKE